MILEYYSASHSRGIRTEAYAGILVQTHRFHRQVDPLPEKLPPSLGDPHNIDCSSYMHVYVYIYIHTYREEECVYIYIHIYVSIYIYIYIYGYRLQCIDFRYV